MLLPSLGITTPQKPFDALVHQKGGRHVVPFRGRLSIHLHLSAIQRRPVRHPVMAARAKD
ncbi:hypothetical protein JMJ77_0009564, partial [Colletotrichum scovillei]